MVNAKPKKPPLYQKVRAELTHEILSGLYPVGSRLPTELDLCKRFGIGRHTAREALRGLQEAGLIRRKAGLGSVVVSTTENEVYAQRIDSLDNLWQYAEATHFEKKSEIIITLREKLAKVMGRSPGERWLRISGLRNTDSNKSSPLCWTEILIPEPYFGIRKKLENSKTPVYLALTEFYEIEIKEVERYITATAMPHDVAEQLGVEPNSPALLERRTYFDKDGKTIEITISLHPGERFAHTHRLIKEKA